MFLEISRTFTFEAAHHLPNFPKGHKCKEVHGHSYKLEVVLEVPHNVERGHVMDFETIDYAVNSLVVEALDHKMINKLVPHGTLEALTVWIVDVLRLSPDIGKFLHRVNVWEGPRSHVRADVLQVNGARAKA